MPSPSWKEIDFFEALIPKAVKEALGDRQVSAETLTDLLMEGKAAAYEALKRYEPTKGDKTAWVFQSVVHHTRKVLRDYLPAGEALPDEVNGASVLLADSSTVSSRPLSPLAIAVLLAAAPPLERLYALHELLGWKRPPRYAKTRLKKRWQECEWVRLVTGNVRKGWEQLKLLKQLCLMAQEGNEHEKELAGFALATIPLDDLNDEGVSLVRSSAQTLLKSANPQHQFAGLWVLHRLQPDVWDGSWIDTLNINALGSVLKAPYAKPKECICPSPLCLHFHPDSLHRSPPSNIADSITESLIHYARRIVCERGQEVRWRGWWLARAVGLYMSFLPDLLPNDLPSMNRIGAMLATIALAHLAPQWGLEQSLEWLPRAPTVIERLRKALKSPEPLERSSALYAARALPLEDRLLLALSGLSDPSVLVRYTARRTMEECALTMEECALWEPFYQELMRPHEHKRLLHRAILNVLARLDFERALEVAARIYQGKGKEAWQEDGWLRHDAGYILLVGVETLRRLDLLEVFRKVLEREPHPSSLVFLPAVQALFVE